MMVSELVAMRTKLMADVTSIAGKCDAEDVQAIQYQVGALCAYVNKQPWTGRRSLLLHIALIVSCMDGIISAAAKGAND